MANVINELKSALGAGARPSKYRVTLSFPGGVSTSSNQRNISVLAKATTFPSMTIGVIEVFNQGRKLPLPGDTTFTNSWNITFYNTEGHDLRRDFVAWMASIDHYQDNKHSGVPASLMVDASVVQLDSAGNETAKYTFHNLFPSEVAEISLGAETLDTVQEFDVTFTFSDWVVGGNTVQEPGSANPPTLNETAL